MKKIEIHANGTEELVFSNETGESDVVRQKIAPYCDAPQRTIDNREVVQRFDRASAEKLVSAFKSNARRLLARLGFGSAAVPVYNGHPDHGSGPAAAGEDGAGVDTEVYARVEDLEARDDGLWATIRKTPLLATLKNALGRLEISPRWTCTQAADGTYRPERLLSLGLVPRGNLPQACVINAKLPEAPEIADADEKNLDKNDKTETTMANSNDDHKETAPETTANAAAPEAAAPKTDETLRELANALGAKDATPQAILDAINAAKTETADLKKRVDELANSEKTARDRAADEVLANALSAGKITPAQKPQLKALLEADFANAKAFIEGLKEAPVFTNGKAATDTAAAAAASEPKDAEDDATAAKRKFYAMANEKIDPAHGVDFPTAVKEFAATKEGRELRARFVRFPAKKQQ